MNDKKYQIWLNNRSVCRSLHQFSEKLPSDLRQEYLVLLDDVVSSQRYMEQGTPDFAAAAFRKYQAMRSSWMTFMQR